MTRINCVPPTELSNQHLLAEYRELPRIFNLVAKRLEKKQWIRPEELPTAYTMGKGHVTFFYDKCSYLIKRQRSLVDEMVRRDFVPNFDPEELWHHHERCGGWIPAWLWNDWIPTTEALAINRQRIKERSTPNMTYFTGATV